jgi:hypothetical protein
MGLFLLLPLALALGHTYAHCHQHFRRCPTCGAEFLRGGEGMRERQCDAGHAGLGAGGAGGPAGMGFDAKLCVCCVGTAIGAIALNGRATAAVFGLAAEMPGGAGP